MRKAAPERPDARSLVHSVKKMPVEFLGAEIDRNGSVRIPRKKAKIFKQKVQHREKYANVEDIIVGYSKFATFIPKGEKRGRYRFDLADLAKLANDTQKYWEELGAINLRPSMDNLPYSVTAMGAGSNPAPRPWVAYLGGHRVLQEASLGGSPGGVERGSGWIKSFLSNEEIRQVWEVSLIETGPEIEDLFDKDSDETRDGPLGISLDTGVRVSGFRSKGERDNLTSIEDWELDDRKDDDEQDGVEVNTESLSCSVGDKAGPEGGRSCEPQPGGRDRLWESGSGAWTDEALHLGDGGDQSRGRSVSPSSSGFSSHQGDRSINVDECSPSVYRFPPGSPAISSTGIDIRWSDPAASPRPPTPEGCWLRTREVAIASRFVEKEGVHRVAWMIQDNSGESPTTLEQHTDGPHLLGELVGLISSLVESAANKGIDVLVVRMEDNKLPKTLLQRPSAIRAPRLFEVVQRLHGVVASSRVHVLVGGPSPMPATLLRRLKPPQVKSSNG